MNLERVSNGQLRFHNGIVIIIIICTAFHLLQQVFVQRSGWRERRQTVGHQQPASFVIRFDVVAPRLVHQLTQNFVPQPFVGQTLGDR